MCTVYWISFNVMLVLGCNCKEIFNGVGYPINNTDNNSRSFSRENNIFQFFRSKFIDYANKNLFCLYAVLYDLVHDGDSI